MSLRRLLRFLANDEIVDQLANSSIVRRGAQLTHYVYQQGMRKLSDVPNAGQAPRGMEKQSRLSSLLRTFARNLQKEIDKEMKKQ